MKEANRTAAASQLFRGYEDVESVIRNLARVVIPSLEEDDSLWTVVNRTCDRYLCPSPA